MRRYLVFVLIIFCTLVWIGFAAAQSDIVTPVPYVYRIDSKGCTYAPVNRRQTGFRVQGVAGIVTALHGVADCKTIHATADGGQELFTDLEIRQVDIARDVVVLSSPGLDALPAEGLAASSLSTTEMLTATLRVVGYPLGLDKQDTDVIESIRAIESLDDVIPDPEEPADFIKRKSPSLTIDVLNIQAQLLPGHSGAPVIDAQNGIVAIGDGGLRSGTVARSWAIPWQEVDLQAVKDVKSQLDALAAKDVAALSFSSTYPDQVERTTTSATYTVQVMDANRNQPIANAEVLLTHSAGYEIGVTDSHGFYTFHLSTDSSTNYTQSQIQVEASGFQSYSRNIPNVLARTSPEMVRLTALSPTVAVPPTNISTAASSSLCSFAFLVLDDQSEAPIRRATITIIVGIRQDTGTTDSTGYYLTHLPCSNEQDVEVRVRVSADGYSPYNRSVFLGDKMTEILLEGKATPTATISVQAEALTSLRVLDRGLTENTYFIEGDSNGQIKVGDDLVVYAEPNPGTEISIALLKVIGKSLTSITAQAILIDSENEIRVRMRVDNNLSFISQSRLVPVFDYADGYLLRPTRIRLRPEHELTVGTQLQALQFERINAEIIDALPTDTIMQITNIGVDGQVAVVKLLAGEWPITGTIVSLLAMPTPTPTVTQPTATFTAQPTQMPTETQQPTPTEPPLVPSMITISAGEFRMGSDDAGLDAHVADCNTSEGVVKRLSCERGWFSDEAPQRVIFLNAFQITEFEITNAEYQACIDQGRCPIRHIAVTSDIPDSLTNFDGANRPVIGVSAYDAETYCNFIGARLPTEEEWEKAARGTDARAYPWGHSFEALKANTCDLNCTLPTFRVPAINDGYARTASVGSFTGGVSPYGVYDMAGNVWEWTASYHSDGSRIIRGGGWSKWFHQSRTAERSRVPSDYASFDIGIRCVK